MLSIGEFSNICKVSAKTLRYYAEIGLILPQEVNPENGYRYYSISQLETMLLINRLKSYHFTLEEIKLILASEESFDEKLYSALNNKQREIKKQIQDLNKTFDQLNSDIATLKRGESIMSYLDSIDVQLTEIPSMYLVSVRKLLTQDEIAVEYGICFGQILKKIAADNLTAAAPPMVLFHSQEFTPLGLDIEFAIPVKEYATGTRDFSPGLCLKTVLKGPYSSLPSIYTKQHEWAAQEGYLLSDTPYEVYITDPSEVAGEDDLITEIYYPVKKKKETK